MEVKQDRGRQAPPSLPEGAIPKVVFSEGTSVQVGFTAVSAPVSSVHTPTQENVTKPSTSQISKALASIKVSTPLDIERSDPLAAIRKVRSMSVNQDPVHKERQRRYSHDEYSSQEPTTFRVPVLSTLKQLAESEDTDSNGQITIEDAGPKHISLGTASSQGFRTRDIRGTYAISNLYQELSLAKELGLEILLLTDSRLFESPMIRLKRLIKDNFWPNLFRSIDSSSIAVAAFDPKTERFPDRRPRIYVPERDPRQIAYYRQYAEEHPDLDLDVCILPATFDAEYVKSLNGKPGILALEMYEDEDGDGNKWLKGHPFVVPGGRFNELYGWDSYFIALGLLEDGYVDTAKSMVINFCYEIEHYGKILNANRSYYLMRSQPPFLTDMALKVYEKIKGKPGAKEFLLKATIAAIKEYFTVWMSAPRLDPVTGLSRYRPDGAGIPPETEASHFDSIIKPYAEKAGMTIEAYQDAYNEGIISNPELDEYFMHDRAVRESGHDTTYRLDGVCANLATVDLNSLLYKYEIDIERIIHKEFGGKLPGLPDYKEYKNKNEMSLPVNEAVFWSKRHKTRKSRVDKYLWNQEKSAYFDYDTVKKCQVDYLSATAFWPLWADLASPIQSFHLVANTLPKLLQLGGLVSGDEKSRGEITIDRPNRQWDYPYGWAPHQILAWQGLENYRFQSEAYNLKVRWLGLMLKSFVDYHGVVVEKYDVTNMKAPHKVDAEYGNQGADVRGAAKEGFGWVNASFTLAYNTLDTHAHRFLESLGTLEQFGPEYRKELLQFAPLKENQEPEDGEVEASSI